jgi:hypothetical protein
MTVGLRKLSSSDGEVLNYEIVLEGLEIGRSQIRRHMSKSTGMPTAYENNVYYALSSGYQSKEIVERLFDVLINEAKSAGISRLTGILSDWEIEASKAIEALGGVIVGPERTADGQRILRFTLSILQ